MDSSPPLYKYSFSKLEEAEGISVESALSLEQGQGCETRGGTRSIAGKESGV